MCGIVGIWHKDKRQISSPLLTKMRDSMFSRGPDHGGIWIGDSIGFGHRRLSIIDLSALGHQPLMDESSGAIIVHNGEVYNFREIKKELEQSGFTFKSQTDTEVILKAYRKWGTSCIEKFIGMFSFAIWDPHAKGILIARDRMGIKPLFYYHDNKILLFASRLSPLLLHPLCPREIDTESLGLYLETGFVPSPWSIVKGVKKLEAGHFLWIDEQTITKQCYWNLDGIDIDQKRDNSEKDLIQQLNLLLQQSVQSHLISDVPVGLFLSGGVDSSLITALSCRYAKEKIKTFCIGFDEKRYDESRYARAIAGYLKTEHYEKIMNSDDLLNLLDSHALHYDEPFADSSSLPTMMLSQFASQHVKVCLSGDGGDELFAGYKDYLLMKTTHCLYKIPFFARRTVGLLLDKVPHKIVSMAGKTLTFDDIVKSYIFIRSLNKNFVTGLLLCKTNVAFEELLRRRLNNFPSGMDIVSQLCRLDADYFLVDDYLQKVDCASMSQSLEVRVPFLDHRLIEFSQTVPIHYKISGLKSKVLLKKVLSKYIPPRLYERPKWGFAIPLDHWFRNELKCTLNEELSIPRIKQFGYLDPNAVQRLIDLHVSKKTDTHHMLWAILVLLRWHKNFLAH